RLGPDDDVLHSIRHVDGAAQEGLGFRSAPAPPEEPTKSVECMGELRRVPQRLKGFDRCTTGCLGLVVAALLHQRKDEMSGCPSHAADVAQSAEDLDRATADAFALDHIIPGP